MKKILERVLELTDVISLLIGCMLSAFVSLAVSDFSNQLGSALIVLGVLVILLFILHHYSSNYVKCKIIEEANNPVTPEAWRCFTKRHHNSCQIVIMVLVLILITSTLSIYMIRNAYISYNADSKMKHEFITLHHKEQSRLLKDVDLSTSECKVEINALYAKIDTIEAKLSVSINEIVERLAE